MNLTHKLLTRALKPVLWGLFCAAAAGSGPAVASVIPVNSLGLFQLDGNATDNEAGHPAGIDWATVYGNCNPGPCPNGQSFITDQTGLGDTILTGGHTKDIYDVALWQSKFTSTSSAPDKDDISHAYAAQFTDPASGDEIVYFGADRFSNNGDADIGFWFFKQPVTAPAGGNGNFSGHHSDGDILIVSNFQQGGALAVIEVFKWSGDAATGSLQPLDSGTGAGDPLTGLFCLPDGLACAASNPANAPSPWPYTFKGSAPPNTFPPNTFFEGGVNITQLLHGTECFSSFLAETRSSTSPTSTLQDYVLGPFKTCSIGVTKTCAVTSLAAPGSGYKFNATYSATVTNTGQGALPAGTTITVVDQATNSTKDTQSTTVGAGGMAPGASVTLNGTFLTNDDPPTNNVTADAVFGGNDLQASSGPVVCTQLVVDELVSITKQCGIPANWVTPNTPARPGVELVLVNSMLVTRVNVSGTISTATPSGATGVPLSITVFDLYPGVSPPGQQLTSNVPAVLAPDSTGNYSYSYYPSAADAPVPSAANVVSFTDTVNVAGNNSTYGVSHVGSAGPITCKVCPCTGVGCP